jgi:hypothetical protein
MGKDVLDLIIKSLRSLPDETKKEWVIAFCDYFYHLQRAKEKNYWLIPVDCLQEIFISTVLTNKGEDGHKSFGQLAHIFGQRINTRNAERKDLYSKMSGAFKIADRKSIERQLESTPLIPNRLQYRQHVHSTAQHMRDELTNCFLDKIKSTPEPVPPCDTFISANFQ